MTRFLHHLAGAAAVASVPLASAAMAWPAVATTGGDNPSNCSQAETAQCVTTSKHCDPNFSKNVWTGECHPQPAVPDWYAVRPAYAPPYAPVDVPPPPPPPPWAQHMQPRWDEGSQRWFWAGV